MAQTNTNIVAQTNKPAPPLDKTNSPANSAEPSAGAEQPLMKKRAWFIKEYTPLRIMNGKLYDFTQLFIDQNRYGSEFVNVRYRNFIVSGKVIQVTKDGLLVAEERTELTVLVKNYGDQDSKIDGSPFHAIAIVSGRHQYINTQGATKTVIAYDCGRGFHPQKDEFKIKQFINDSGKEVAMPVTEWDLQ